MRRFVPLAAVLIATACADSEPPDAVPADGGGAYNVVAPVKAPLADEGEPAIGQWIQSMQDEQTVLQFGPANTEPLFSMSCGPDGGILINRHGTVASGGGEMMGVTIGAQSRNLSVETAQGPLPRLRASVPAQDELLAQLAGAQQPIRISMGDGPPLVLPSDPAIAQFIKGCGNPRPVARPAQPAPLAPDNGSATANSMR